ncbi:MAG: SDR family NAD(P)-dependent oxidoreductase [Anaerolineae bacterium]
MCPTRNPLRTFLQGCGNQPHPRIDILVNNACVTLTGTFEQVSDGDFEWLFGINFRGVVRKTRAFCHC